MGVEDILYDDEQQLRRELFEEESAVLRYAREANDEQSRLVEELISVAPNAPGELIYPLVQEVQGGFMSFEDAAQTAVDSVQMMATQAIQRQEPEKNWWDKITGGAYEGIKTATKWGFAGLEFLPQTAVNLASRQYQFAQRAFGAIPGQEEFGYGDYEAPKTGFFDGLIASTDLGSLLTGAESGNGFFIGEEAKIQQEQKAAEYRGTIDGEAWTLGRGWANNFASPDSQAYNITSGLIDAAAALAIPSIPGSKAVTRGARAAGRPLGKADEFAEGVERTLRSARGIVALPGSRRARLAGITYSGRPHIDRRTVSSWLQSNQGKDVIERVRRIDSIEEAADVFKDASADFWLDVVDATEFDDVKRLLENKLGLEGLGRPDQIRIGPMADRRRSMFGIQSIDDANGRNAPGRVKSGFQSWFARNFSAVPGSEMVVVSDDVRDLTQTIKNARDYLRLYRIEGAERDQILRNLTRSLISGGRDGNIQNALKELDDVLITKLAEGDVGRVARRRAKKGRPPGDDEAVDAGVDAAKRFYRDLFSKFRNDVGEYNLFGTIDETGDRLMVKGLNFTEDGEAVIRANGTLVSATAHIPSEMRKFAGYMPDPRKLRRASAKYSFLWTRHGADPSKWGDPRLLVSLMDNIQMDIWKPATLMTGGYMARNNLESIMRSMLTPGIKTGPFHPIHWFRAISRKEVIGDVNGVGFDVDAPYLARTTNNEYLDSMNARPREAQDIIDNEKVGFRSGHYKLIKRPDEFADPTTVNEYVEGVANELRLLANTTVGQIAADTYRITRNREDTIRTVRDWLTGVDDEYFMGRYGVRRGQGEEDLRRINSMWQNKRILPEGASEPSEVVRGNINMIREDGTYDLDNIEAYLDQIILHRLDEISGISGEAIAGAGGVLDDFSGGLLDVIADALTTGTFRSSFDGIEKPSFLKGNSVDVLDAESFEYSKEMLEEIRAMWEQGVPLPQFVKAPVKLENVRFGKTGAPIAKAWRRTIDHFFGTVFAKKEAWLNRSPVFRKYYYLRIADLSDEITQETASEIMNNIYRGTFDLQERRVMALESLAGRRKQKPKLSQPKRAKEQFDRLNAAKRDADGNFVVGRGGSRRVLTADERQIEMQNLQDRVIYKGKEMSRAEADALIEADMPALTWNGRQITDEEYDELLTQARKELEEAKGKFTDRYAERYVGSKELWKLIKERADGVGVPVGDAPKLTTDQLDIAAKAFALEETKTVFFNAADKNNFADILRIVVPFGSAWAEMAKFYYKQVLTKPNRLKNMGVSVQGFRDMDPDGDGKGFIYTDPVSGEPVFNYPFSDWMIPFVSAGAGAVLGETFFGRASPVRGAIGGAAVLGGAGLLARERVASTLGDIKPELVAPVKSLSMSFQVLPGVGPLVQIPLNELLGDKPGADQLMELISPYGAPELGIRGLAPAWLEKVYDGISADPSSDPLYADLKVDAYRALSTSGDYDLASQEDAARMSEDAGTIAAYLLAYRGFAQFLGPVRGQIQFAIPTEFDGKITIDDVEYEIEADYIQSAMLSATFRAMQEVDYENAVIDFLRTFGPDMMLYTVGKTRSKVEGLDASAQFGDWERNNRDIVNAFGDVYGYFAPIGSEFDLQTYIRQIEEGAREKITDPAEVLADAQAVVGKALYMEAVRSFPRNPSDMDEIELGLYRDKLEEELPGFEFAPINIRERPQILEQIVQAARSELLDGNRVAEGARLYIDYREDVLREAINRNYGVERAGMLTRKENADLRRVLREYADQIVAQYPEFQRLYSRVFFDEVDAVQ